MPTPLFHITDLGNLPSIVKCGGLRCLNLMRKEGTKFKDIAYNSVQEQRARTVVTCGKKGHLHDYVPFYFAPRSPMLFTISKGNVASCTNGQEDVLYLVSSVARVQKAGLSFVFSDGHGIMALTNFYDDLQHLDKVDWDIMKAKYWRDSNDDGDRCRRRQAEFLVHSFFPWECFKSIAVKRVSHIAKVRGLLGSIGNDTPIEAMPAWYY